ncbi:hypothetical protein RI367_001319 [Sorochytrium milnesiophthora]
MSYQNPDIANSISGWNDPQTVLLARASFSSSSSSSSIAGVARKHVYSPSPSVPQSDSPQRTQSASPLLPPPPAFPSDVAGGPVTPQPTPPPQAQASVSGTAPQLSADELVALLQSLVGKAAAQCPAAKKRILADCEKRIAVLTAQLQQNQVPDFLQLELSSLLTAIDRSDVAAARKKIEHMSLQFVDYTQWITGVKRLLNEFLASAQ